MRRSTLSAYTGGYLRRGGTSDPVHPSGSRDLTQMSRELILRAALQIIDLDGVDGRSMRRVGIRVGPPSVALAVRGEQHRITRGGRRTGVGPTGSREHRAMVEPASLAARSSRRLALAHSHVALHDAVLDPNRDYQPTVSQRTHRKVTTSNPSRGCGCCRCPETSHSRADTGGLTRVELPVCGFTTSATHFSRHRRRPNVLQAGPCQGQPGPDRPVRRPPDPG
jgi:hypothetical protein